MFFRNGKSFSTVGILISKDAQYLVEVKFMDEIMFYSSQIGENIVLTNDDEKKLLEQIAKGDKRATDKLVKAHIKFVISVAKNYQNMGLDLNDLVMEGVIGLLKAAEKFDTSKNVKFITYAVWWIKESIMAGIRETGKEVRFPGNAYKEMQSKKWNFIHFEDKCKNENGESKEIGEIISIQDCNTRTPEEDCMRTFSRLQLKKAINSLKEKEKLVIIKRFGLDNGETKSLSEVGKEMKLVKESIRQIEVKAIKNLKRIIEADDLGIKIAA